MTNEDFLICLQEIEQNFNVRSFVYDGIEFWPQLRVMLYNECAGRNGGVDVRDSSLIKKVSAFFLSFFERFYDRKHHSTVRQSDCYFLTASNSRYKVEGRGFVDTFVSPLIEWMNDSYHIDELVPMMDYRLPRSEKTYFIQHHIYLEYLIAACFPKRQSSSIGWLDDWDQLSAFLYSKGHCTNLNVRAIEKRLKQLSLLSRWFEKRLMAIRPKWAAVMCYYSTSAFALIHAAKRLGIKTMDLQHGVQAKGHVAYDAFYNIPDQGWGLLPDVFWNWTKNDVDNINRWGEGKHRGIEGGIIWHEYLKNTPELNEDCFKQLKTINPSAKPYILVTLQPLNDNQEFINLLIKAIKSNWGDRYFWLIRLHPGMFEQIEKYKALFNFDNSDVSVATSSPLPLLLEKANLHVTRYSSVVIEAAMYNVASLVEKGRTYYQSYEESDLIVYFSDDLQEAYKLHKSFEIQIPKASMPDSMQVWKNLLNDDF